MHKKKLFSLISETETKIAGKKKKYSRGNVNSSRSRKNKKKEKIKEIKRTPNDERGKKREKNFDVDR